MSTKKADKTTEDRQEPQSTPAPQAEAATASPPSNDAAKQPSSTSSNVAATEEDADVELEQQLAEYETIIKRQQAEFDNYRKRTLEEKRKLLRYAPEEFIKALLPILNSYEQALNQASTQENSELTSFIKGFTFIKQQFDSILAEHNVRISTTIGDAFDPARHQAVMLADSSPTKETIAVDTVTEIIEQGYLFHERVIKTAHVKVLKKTLPPAAPSVEKEPTTAEPADCSPENINPNQTPPQANDEQEK